jgi:hypothetical protein
MKRIQWFSACIWSGALLFLMGCTKQAVDSTANWPTTDIKFLGHKGAGSNNYNDVNIEHSMASFNEALKVMDGVEIDMQMSLDGTLWLFHDCDIWNDVCTNNHHQSLISMHDSQIKNITVCSRGKSDRIYKLSELIDLWNSSANGFSISLEIKEFCDDTMYTHAGGKTYYYNKLVTKLAALLKNPKHPISQMFVEVSQKSIVDGLKTYSYLDGLQYLLFDYYPFAQLVSRAKADGFTGVSCDFRDATLTYDAVQKEKNSGFHVQLWTPYTQAELQKSFDLHPNYIQTDNMAAKADLQVK